LAKDPARYPWTGYAKYMGRVKDPILPLEIRPVLELMDANPAKARQNWAAYIKEGLARKGWEEFHKNQEILKADARKVGIQASSALESPVERWRLDLTLPETWKALLQRDGYREAPQGRRWSLLMEEAAYLATQLAGIRQTEVARFFELKQSTISRALARMEARWSADPTRKERIMQWSRTLRKTEPTLSKIPTA